MYNILEISKNLSYAILRLHACLTFSVNTCIRNYLAYTHEICLHLLHRLTVAIKIADLKF